MANLHLIGLSSRFRTVLDTVSTVAPSNCTVLIQEQPGTGKEVIARAIHQAGPRRNNYRFVALNCAAIPAAIAGKRAVRPSSAAHSPAQWPRRWGGFRLPNHGTLFGRDRRTSRRTTAQASRALQEKGRSWE